MAARGIISLALLTRTILRPTSSRPILTAWNHPRVTTSALVSNSRGAKSKTVTKLKDLPQGPLPPLPTNDPVEDANPKWPDLFQEHLNNMRKYKDCVLLTHVGDFYEIYFEHVPQYAPLLNLKQAEKHTTRGKVPMAGFKADQLDKYLKILVNSLGVKVAIADQIPLPVDGRASKGKGTMFHRPVHRVVTPGTLIDESFVDSLSGNYLLAVHVDPLTSKSRVGKVGKVGISWIDLSSGDFHVQTSELASLPSVIASVSPKEVVLPSSWQSAEPKRLRDLVGELACPVEFHQVTDAAVLAADWASMLDRPLTVEQQAEFTTQELAAGDLILAYIRDRLQNTTLALQPPTRRSEEDFMTIDKQSLRGLEIKSLLRDGSFKGSLLHTERKTVTKAGARLLSQRLLSPSTLLAVIEKRLEVVEELLRHDALREDVISLLKETSDIKSLLQKFSINRGAADDLLHMAETVELMRNMAQILQDHLSVHNAGYPDLKSERSSFVDFLERMDLDGPTKLAKAISNAIDKEELNKQHLVEAGERENAEQMAEAVVEADLHGTSNPKTGKRPKTAANSIPDDGSEDIWIMRKSASQSLRDAHSDLERLFEEKLQLTIDLRATLGADSLTLQWTPKHGYHCHIKGKDAKADRRGLQIVSLSKSTRGFHNAEWEKLGLQIDETKYRIRTEEDIVFDKLRKQVIDNIPKLRRNAEVLAEIDVACSSATIAKERNLIRPKLNSGTAHTIIGGRHPTVDVGLQESGRPFTANDCSVGSAENIYLITGPNMAGKSTYLRQNVLITILAQTGCFVPADYAEIGLVDKIFSRVGSADNLYEDQSTFMVEMLETAEILRQATPRSFVIMDEVGRGTTPEDGIALGYACLHHLHYTNKCRALFATHFHDLADMTAPFERLGCWCTDVMENADGTWSYVHRLKRGVNRESHALKVARLAGMPEEAIAVALEVLNGLRTDARGENAPVPMSAAG